MTQVFDADRFAGCLLGLAVGDAVGTTLEFTVRDAGPPLTDMVGGGPFQLPKGAWTDDTSMALCLGYSLVHQGAFDSADQMRRYCKWWRHGYLSSTGDCFDIGSTTSQALARFEATEAPFSGSSDPNQAGNGSIMRLAPISMFFADRPDTAIAQAAESSRTTHAASECLDACRLLCAILLAGLRGVSKDQMLGAEPALTEPKLISIARGTYRGKTRSQISGSGYVVDSLEAALWCVANTTTFRAAVLMAANLGDDADTTAAITGQIAGAHYGASAIPKSWLEPLVMGDEIRALALDLMPNDRSTTSR